MSDRKEPAKNENRHRQLRAAAEDKLARTPPTETAGKSAENILHELQVHQIELEMQNDELRRAQVALEESRDKYLDLYDFAPVGYFTLTRVGRIVEANLAGAELLGVGRPKLVGCGLGRFAALGDCDRWDQHLMSVLHSAEKQSCELTFTRKDGSTFYAHLDSIRLDRPGQEAGDDGPGPMMRVAMSDISGRKRAEQALCEVLDELDQRVAQRTADLSRAVTTLQAEVTGRILAEQVLRKRSEELQAMSRFPDESPTPVLRVDPRGAILYANENAEENLLRPWGVPPTGVLPASLGGEVVAALGNGKAKEMEITAGARAFLLTLAPIAKAGYVNLYARDITERKRAEESLRDSEARFRTLVEAVTDYTYKVTVHDGRILEAIHGPGCVGATGYSPEEFHADPELWLRMVHPEDQPVVIEQAAKISSGLKVRPLEHRIIHKNGEIRWVRNTTVSRYDDRGQCTGYEGLIQDVTEHRKLQEQFAQAQKMEAVGQLAGGIAHDFRNQLTVIKGYNEMLLRQESITEESRGFLDEIKRATDRSTRLTGELLAFSRKEMIRPEVVDLNVLIADLSKSLVRMIGEDVRLTIAPGPGLGSVNVDTGQFQQALINLVVNAHDAMPKGGQLRIETANVDVDEQFVKAHVGASAGPHVVVTMTDTGTGIDAETIKRIFEPFFTTKSVGQGTGLGLSMVYGFVKQSEGNITAESKVGHGTTFRIYLPRVVEIAEPRPEGSGRTPQLRGQGTIMVVEDEESIRHLLTRTLTNCGYTVLAAADPEEALPLASSHEGPIDLLLTDVVMPGMNGIDLAQHLHKSMPRLRVLFMSGYTDRMLDAHGFDGEQMSLLVKPFSPQTVAEAVHKATQAATG